jgi:hypothetical protein
MSILVNVYCGGSIFYRCVRYVFLMPHFAQCVFRQFRKWEAKHTAQKKEMKIILHCVRDIWKRHTKIYLFIFWRAENVFNYTQIIAEKIFAVRTPYTTSSSSTTTFSCVHKAKSQRMNFFFASLCTFWCRRKKKMWSSSSAVYARERETFIFCMMARKALLDLQGGLLGVRCAFPKILSHRNILVWVLIYFLGFTV